MKPIRKKLIELTANLADEPAKTIQDLEELIHTLVVKAKFETYQAISEKIANMEIGKIYQQVASEQRAYSLYCAGKHFTEIIEMLGDEYPELDSDQIEKIVNDAKERFDERNIPLENSHE